MSTKLFDLKKDRQLALDKADRIVAAAENARRTLTAEEASIVDYSMKEVNGFNAQIKVIESNNTLRTQFPSGVVLTDGGARSFSRAPKMQLSEEYFGGFMRYVQSGGREISAALYEGAGSAGGYAVPIMVDDQIVPLAPQEMAMRRTCTVIPTVMDIKIPIQQSFGTTAAKAELSAFGEVEPTLEQTTLSAYMAGNLHNISWELAQDVPAFQAFAVDDLVLSQQMYEENLYCNGTGTGEAQGIFGNVGAGITDEPDTNGNLVSITATFDVLGTLNAVYHPNASWLMTRATGVIIRKAQSQSNLFSPVWTRVGKQDFLHGYPVEFSAYAPTAARGATPVLFGDFKRAYVIGDRGGSGINVKVLDQPLASQGILQLLAYRRTDGRVRRSEAVQGITIAAS
jgi:HK97 family phage major capsid protein